MSLVVKSLDAATSTGAGSAIFFDTPKSVFGLQVTGSGDGIVTLEGTLDGANWFGVSVTVSGSGYASGSGKPLIGIRANITTYNSGSFTATIAAS